jgi:hypothetical protein
VIRIGLLAALLCFGMAAPSLAQSGQPSTAELPQNVPRIKGHFTFMVAGGLDLDVFGDVVTIGLSCDPEPDMETSCNQQTSLIQVSDLLHYPDVYRSVQKRWQASAGFGIFNKDELIVQVTRSRAPAEASIGLGRFQSAEGDRTIRASFGTYEDQTIEGGLRHYFRTVGRSKSYANLLYGRRKVEAISAVLTADGLDGNFGLVRFYDTATVNTAAVVFGITVERGPVGIFVEAGFRWTAKLKQIDDDLAVLGVSMINDTGSRIFMPASAGLVLRF